MPIELSPDLEAIVMEKMAWGGFSTPEAVLRRALDLLVDEAAYPPERSWTLEELRREVALGLEELDRGEALDGAAFFSELRAKYFKPEDAAR